MIFIPQTLIQTPQYQKLRSNSIDEQPQLSGYTIQRRSHKQCSRVHTHSRNLHSYSVIYTNFFLLIEFVLGFMMTRLSITFTILLNITITIQEQYSINDGKARILATSPSTINIDILFTKNRLHNSTYL